MKTTELLACTAIALTIALPGLVSAKTTTVAHAAALKQPLAKVTALAAATSSKVVLPATIASPAASGNNLGITVHGGSATISAGTITTSPALVAVAAPTPVIPVVTTQTGLIDNTGAGTGSYTQTTIKNGNTTIIDTLDTFKSGKSTLNTAIDTATKNANGSTTYNNENISGTGQTTDTIETLTKNANGTYSIAGTVSSGGQTEIFSGVRTITASGNTTAETLTNAAGAKETLNFTTVLSGDATASLETGTGFNGKVVNSATLLTTNTAPANAGARVASDSYSGPFTYTQTSSQAGSAKVLVNDRSYANGAATVTTEIIQSSGAITTYTEAASNITSSGAQSSNTHFYDYTLTSPGAWNISGNYAFQNGPYGTLKGTEVATNYGYNTNINYTNQKNQVETESQQKLVVGDASLYIDSGTSYVGTPYGSITLN